ncbi:phosphatase PAP2 family protein [Flavobacterium urumqiense]|uniref:PAP2 superfamily protein n=1 Tax=Flavobacterium urumqiense TaxID=935224 RepID=A0A1H5YL13_9FLAO|nr:phosphatase PAP2 family protein [Flavobacterium urumqiense]SEG24768.1 PAP2 superfamily protein [Flavobacterium urumqiense]
MIYKNVLFFIMMLFNLVCSAQSVPISIPVDSLGVKNKTQIQFKTKQLIIPAVLIGYGIIGIGNDQLKSFNNQIKEEVKENIDKKFTIDDFSQYLPLASVYGLSAIGIKGKNNFRDKTVIVATSYLIMGIAVNSLKRTLKVERPDGSGFNSFPSGHTATAFMGAELVYQEYKDVSAWYGISGYLVATGTGVFRLYNNRHWLTDVIAGAGIGILSAKAAYWLYPSVNRLLVSKKPTNKKTTFIPYYDGKQVGFGLVSTF